LLNVPDGADQVPIVAIPPKLPFKFTVSPSQIEALFPALAVGAIITSTVTLSDTAGHGPGGSLVVNVNVAVPVAIEGVNVDVRLLGFPKVPLGLLQVAEVAPPPITPLRLMELPPHMLVAAPASTVAAGFTVIVTFDVTVLQAALGFVATMVNVTLPGTAAVYWGFSPGLLVKLPLGALQVKSVAVEFAVAFNCTGIPWQMVWGEPALAVIGAKTFKGTGIDMEGHGPGGSIVVKVRVTEEPLCTEGS